MTISVVSYAAMVKVSAESDPAEDDGYPRTLTVLRVLADAGDTGILAPDIAYRFNKPLSQQRRNSVVNQILIRHGIRGHAFRVSARSFRYHNVQTYRWFITDTGNKYLESGGYHAAIADIRRDAAITAQEREQRLIRRQLVLKAAPALVAQLPPGCNKSRAELIIKLYDQGLVMEEIGQLFGLTRERIRQIKRDINVRPCACWNCIP